jgi:hypothetical protein
MFFLQRHDLPDRVSNVMGSSRTWGSLREWRTTGTITQERESTLVICDDALVPPPSYLSLPVSLRCSFDDDDGGVVEQNRSY